MARYAIGDVHGQYDALMRLLDQLSYDEKQDELWFVGDIVNRGPKSLEALRFVVGCGARAKVVMGNHDFTLMVQAHGLDRGRVKRSTMEILSASDSEDLIEAMCRWPLFVENEDVVMVHAGVYPLWMREMARQENAQYQSAMQDPTTRKEFLQAVYRNGGGIWHEKGVAHSCFAVNAFTRMRFLSGARLDFDSKLPPKEAARELVPWYAWHEVRQNFRVIFGHWAALGLNIKDKWACLDSGAAWGGALTAFDIDRWCVAGQVKCSKENRVIKAVKAVHKKKNAKQEEAKTKKKGGKKKG